MPARAPTRPVSKPTHLKVCVALDLSPAADDLLSDLYADLGPDVTWVQPQNMHLTLRFIGDVGPKVLRAMERVLELVQILPFSLDISGLSLQPDPVGEYAATLCVGVAQSKALKDLYLQVNHALVRMNLPPAGRAFEPHITLARVRPEADIATLAGYLHENQGFEGTLNMIDQFNIYHTQLTPAGLMYVPYASFRLAAGLNNADHL